MPKNFSNTFWIFKGSWQILKKNKKLLFLSLIPIFIIGIIPLGLLIFSLLHIFRYETFGIGVLCLVLFFLSLFLAYPIFIFFEAALIQCINKALRNEAISLRESLSIARRRFQMILKWLFINFTFRMPMFAAPKTALIFYPMTVSWNLLTTFVVPIIVLENLHPKKAIAKSSQLFEKIWGETAICEFSIGSLFAILGIGGFFLITASPLLFMDVIRSSPFLYQNIELVLGFAWGLLIVMLLILGIIIATLREIFIIILYQYASHGKKSSFFNEKFIKNIFK